MFCLGLCDEFCWIPVFWHMADCVSKHRKRKQNIVPKKWMLRASNCRRSIKKLCNCKKHEITSLYCNIFMCIFLLSCLLLHQPDFIYCKFSVSFVFFGESLGLSPRMRRIVAFWWPTPISSRPPESHIRKSWECRNISEGEDDEILKILEVYKISVKLGSRNIFCVFPKTGGSDTGPFFLIFSQYQVDYSRFPPISWDLVAFCHSRRCWWDLGVYLGSVWRCGIWWLEGHDGGYLPFLRLEAPCWLLRWSFFLNLGDYCFKGMME